jgi:hypothetical protein
MFAGRSVRPAGVALWVCMEDQSIDGCRLDPVTRCASLDDRVEVNGRVEWLVVRPGEVDTDSSPNLASKLFRREH